MSVKAKLLIDDKEINVLRFSFGFNQGADVSGRPSQKPIFVGLQLVIETRKDLDLTDWAFASNQTKQLELHIYPVILGGKTRKLFFYDCHLLKWDNNFSATGTEPMSETLNISAGGVTDSSFNTEYSTYWRKTYPEKEVEAYVRNNSHEKKVMRCYFTNLEGRESNDYEVGDKIILQIETQNRIGDKITIHLDDKSHDFTYNGNILKNDKLQNYEINDDLEKIELEVISQS